MGGEPRAGSGLDPLEQRDHVGATGAHIQRTGTVEEHPVGRIQADQVELVRRSRAEQPERVIEDLGHEIPRGLAVSVLGGPVVSELSGPTRDSPG